MDAENYAKALKKEDDPTIVETQITTDGEEYYGYARRLTEEEKPPYRFSEKNKTPRVPTIRVNWSKDSKKISVVKIDQRKVADLWVINSLANPRPKLETYKYGCRARPTNRNRRSRYSILRRRHGSRSRPTDLRTSSCRSTLPR